MAAAANDHGVIMSLWLRIAPGGRPAAMAADRLPGEGE